jgi:hypothetical protein
VAQSWNAHEVMLFAARSVFPALVKGTPPSRALLQIVDFAITLPIQTHAALTSAALSFLGAFSPVVVHEAPDIANMAPRFFMQHLLKPSTQPAASIGLLEWAKHSKTSQQISIELIDALVSQYTSVFNELRGESLVRVVKSLSYLMLQVPPNTVWVFVIAQHWCIMLCNVIDGFDRLHCSMNDLYNRCRLASPN